VFICSGVCVRLVPCVSEYEMKVTVFVSRVV
jgi:hypothetical protein